MRRAFRRLCASEDGQVAVEYALVTALIAVAMAAALEVLHGSLAQYFRDLAGEIAGPYP